MSPIRKKTVVFHVGAHKTGTSLIQKYMRDNVSVLRQHRIYYLSRSAMNDYVGWGDKLRRDPDPLARKMRNMLAIPWFKVLIASHENTLGRPLVKGGAHLYPRAPEIIDALGRLLRPHRPKIFLSIRPQEQFLESNYLQSIHQGGHQAFQAWLDRVDLDAVSWAPVVDKLCETFGREHVEIVDFRRIKHGQQAYVNHFFTRIDPRYAFKVEYAPMRNPSISGKGLRMALAANPHLRTGEQRKLMRVFLQKHFSNVRYPRPVLFSDEQKQWLRDRYGAEYERLVGANGSAAADAEPPVPPGSAPRRPTTVRNDRAAREVEA
jgi:hypothetical protein